MTSDDASTEPQSRAVASRERLLAAAAEVIVEQGYDGAGVAEIARRADLTTGAIYGKFSGKAQLLAAAVEDQMAAELSDILDEAAATSVVELIGALGASLVEPDGAAHGELLLEAFAAAQRNDELRHVIVDGLAEDGRRMAELIDDGKSTGLVDPEIDTASITTLCQSVTLGFMLLRAVRCELPAPQDWGALIDRLVSVAPPVPDPAPEPPIST